ncbi:PREDICTED: uncharacterized protein LOC109357993 [Lupinus angustifolius]|uniref:uncharacterized protein LOC109357993 n=1 Tax=Lupinus angustifolius TaxID=3871 RepID=UPI00092F7B22|nr:PREDICTED: uncharacterized protein LOC109357993 [Lupinus angustifolius]
MCDATDYAVGAILGKRKAKFFHAIHYASKEFNLEIKDKKGSENCVEDHLSRLVNQEVIVTESEVVEEFPDEKLIMVQERPWFADMTNLKAIGVIPKELSWHQKRRFLRESHHLQYGGHFNGERTAAKVLQYGFYWPSVFKDAHKYAQQCDKFQRSGEISKRNGMPLTNIQESEMFDCWGIDFMRPFPLSCSQVYIVVAVDYVSKWVEAIATQKDDAKIVIKFLKRNVFSRFGTPWVLISDGGSHFCNSQLEKVLQH